MTKFYLLKKTAGLAGRWAALLALALAAGWAAAALYLDLPAGAYARTLASAVCAIAALGSLLAFRGRGKGLVICAAVSALVLGWWLTLKPSNERAWQPDQDRAAWAEIKGDTILIHNVRNCAYRTETDYTPRWETRSYDLSKISGLDISLTYWVSPLIAHPILSFRFGANDYVAISIETRKEAGEAYSTFRGFFRQYEMIYTVGDERDLLRLRTNYRKGEEMYLYRTRATPARAREIFLNYLARLNRLRDQPEWYNELANNCTSNVAALAGEKRRDWRLLLNGRADRMLYEWGYLAGDLPFARLKAQAHINEAARAAGDAPDFSRRIRAGRAGF